MSLLKEISGQVGRFNEVEAAEVDAQIVNSVDVNVIGTLVATNFQLPAVVPAGQRYFLAAGVDGLAEWAPASLDAFGQLAGSDSVSIGNGDQITFSSTGIPAIGFTSTDTTSFVIKTTGVYQVDVFVMASNGSDAGDVQPIIVDLRVDSATFLPYITQSNVTPLGLGTLAMVSTASWMVPLEAGAEVALRNVTGASLQFALTTGLNRSFSLKMLGQL
jgi:hypothetical protein